MTLNANKGSLKIYFGDFGLRHRFQEQIALTSTETDMEKLRMKFLALNLDFDGPSFDFLRLRKTAHEGIKDRYPVEVVIFAVVGQSFVNTVANRHGHAAYHNKHY